jgi:hypothetical protein
MLPFEWTASRVHFPITMVDICVPWFAIDLITTGYNETLANMEIPTTIDGFSLLSCFTNPAFLSLQRQLSVTLTLTHNGYSHL